jgi:myosin-1
MLLNKEDQCIIISGESGAGKTEASKKILQFVAAVSKSHERAEQIKERLIKSNPVLEGTCCWGMRGANLRAAFGNAKTLRNDNSSRFGKYMEIQFERDGTPVGGKISNYLLEKSRVVTRAVGERSFHVFYQLLKGATDEQMRALKLERDADKYAYLACSQCSTVEGVMDASDWRLMQEGCLLLGWSKVR